MVTSLMFVAAKPIEETSAKANVASQTIHPASAVARWRACHARAATEGRTKATQSLATPRIRNNVPATGVAPMDRANQPFCTVPTPARARAARARKILGLKRDGRDAVT
jgi:hypothetical protein